MFMLHFMNDMVLGKLVRGLEIMLRDRNWDQFTKRLKREGGNKELGSVEALSGPQTVASGTTESASLGSFLKMYILEPSKLLNWKVWKWDPVISFNMLSR